MGIEFGSFLGCNLNNYHYNFDSDRISCFEMHYELIVISNVIVTTNVSREQENI